MRSLLPIQDLLREPEGKAGNSGRYHHDGSSFFQGKQAMAEL